MSTPAKPKRNVKPHSSLAAWRLEMGYDQRTAAKILGVSQGYYSRLERKVQTPRPQKADSIRKLTGVALDELMGIAS